MDGVGDQGGIVVLHVVPSVVGDDLGAALGQTCQLFLHGPPLGVPTRPKLFAAGRAPGDHGEGKLSEVPGLGPDLGGAGREAEQLPHDRLALVG